MYILSKKFIKKNLIYKLIFLSITTLVINSCAKGKKNSPPKIDSNVISNLNQQLKDFNQSYNYKVANTSSIEGKKKWWEVVAEVCGIAIANAGGAQIGASSAQTVAVAAGVATGGTGYAVVTAIGGAIGDSYTVYTQFYQRVGNFNNVDPKGAFVIYSLPQEFSYLNNLGLLHNNGLERIYFSTTNPQTDLQWMASNINNINDVDYVKLYNFVEFKDLINNIKSVSKKFSENNFNYTILLNEYKMRGLMDEESATILSYFFEAVSKAVVFEDVKQINDFYINAIKNSNLNTKTKEAIFASLVVYIQSYYYWLNFQIEE